MGIAASDLVLDASLDKVATGTIITVCSAQPTTRAEAVTTFKLLDVAVDAGDFSKADGDVSGRKLIIAAQNAVPVDTSGTGNHVAVSDATDLLYVTTCDPQALTSGNTANLPAWEIEHRDPVAA